MSNPIAAEGLHLLQELEAAMRSRGLWSQTPPGAEALSSQAPFACDTLTFEQWLQFIFVPKLTALIEANEPLPGAMKILPMAQQSWRDTPDTQRVERVLARFDALYEEA
ncbi:dTDP-4-dehydrorhamnose 3,5-epimerase [Saliniradius amylolyticus]|uniref:dTDP-4-dehydrorhamnose 3,5-epimerase n=1 Tax=Saliniradius amylolyticus TaxID=2183582 RepID=A0A2S2E4V2_9ALTE|nr:YqcC family protein [Saliniradius amylolyticus]AWL12619.1 dTDP-4-dehydrorhamnose 3,5-epimerase [Saliniradius amylolyticus]